MQNINNLLNEIKTIKEHHDEIAKNTGSNFNLMNIMGIGHYEVKTHSPILADLLDPNGSHGQGEVFLDLFIQECLPSDEPDNFSSTFDSKSAQVWKEKHIGPVTKDTTGGRIDIYIQDKNAKRIFIENKIYAGDQPNQLLRYLAHDPSAKLIYLTLDGRKTSEKNIDHNSVISLSYENDIINWLILCRKEVAVVPIIRESLTTYINLLKELTNQNTNQAMSQKITKLVLKSEENLNTFNALVAERINVRNEVITDTISEVSAINWEKDYQLRMTETWSSRKINSTLEFTRDCWEDFKITFQFNATDCNGLYFGIHGDAKSLGEKRNLLLEKAQEHYGSMNQNGYWVAWKYWEEYKNWSPETLTKIRFEKNSENESVFLQELKNRVISLRDICNEFC